jgi:hypothetical protein
VLRVDGGDHVGFVLEPQVWGEREDTAGAKPLRLSDTVSISPGHPAD